MKKLFFSLVAVIVAATTMYAQSSLVATLSHKGEISVFHGASSLKQAMEAADNGDIITLASGRYEAANITKAITLRGAGMEENAVTGSAKTQLVGDIEINIKDSTSEHLSIEGIYHDGRISLYGMINEALFQKSRFNSIYGTSSKLSLALTLIHCHIVDRIRLSETTSSTFYSCVVSGPSKGEFANCVIITNKDVWSLSNCFFTNCLLNIRSISTLDESNMSTYSAGTMIYGHSLFERIGKQGNKDIESVDDFNALFKPGTFYELTDEAKSEYVGQDGKEMGIYGGNLPYETRILSPQITKCNVAAKTTADGKLSVDIEVKAAE